jgi:hypothetical protein
MSRHQSWQSGATQASILHKTVVRLFVMQTRMIRCIGCELKGGRLSTLENGCTAEEDGDGAKFGIPEPRRISSQSAENHMRCNSLHNDDSMGDFSSP